MMTKLGLLEVGTITPQLWIKEDWKIDMGFERVVSNKGGMSTKWKTTIILKRKRQWSPRPTIKVRSMNYLKLEEKELARPSAKGCWDFTRRASHHSSKSSIDFDRMQKSWQCHQEGNFHTAERLIGAGRPAINECEECNKSIRQNAGSDDHYICGIN